MTQVPNPSLRILVVDDQEGILRCMRDLLTALGHLVVTVLCPTEALAALEARNVRFDCMFTDVDLPIMSGDKLAERAVQLECGLHVIYMSGWQQRELEQDGTLLPGQAFLSKPFSLEQLQELLARVLASRAIADQAVDVRKIDARSTGTE